MKFSYAIFDMDGLMFDTENLFVRAFEEAIGPEIGYRFSREKMKQLIGLNHQAALETFPRLFPGCPAPCEACLTRFRAWMQEYIRENGIPVIFADNLKDNQRLFREFEGKETKLKTEEIDGVVFATDKKAAENGIYAYYVKQDGKIVSNVEFYYKKVRIKEKENRKWFENWFW